MWCLGGFWEVCFYLIGHLIPLNPRYYRFIFRVPRVEEGVGLIWLCPASRVFAFAKTLFLCIS